MSEFWQLKRRGKQYYAERRAGKERIRESLKTSDKKIGENLIAQRNRALLDPAHHPAHETTLAAALLDMQANRKSRGKAQGTLKMYEQKSAHLARVMGGDRSLATVDAEAVDKYIETRQAEGAANATIGKELTTLRLTLRLMRRRGRYPYTVDQVMPDGWNGASKPKTRYLTPKEVGALLDYLPTKRAAHVAYLIATGARWGESVRATRAHVRDQVVQIEGTKTEASKSEIPISPLVAELLKRALLLAPGDNPLFEKWTNVRRDLHAACDAITEQWRDEYAKLGRAGEAPKFARCSPNDLRRTLSTWHVQQGVDLYSVSKLMRHKDTRMVERTYAAITATDVGKRIEAGLSTFAKAQLETTVTKLRPEGENSTDTAGAADSETSQNPPGIRAQGQNRTVDTRIFKPRGLTKRRGNLGRTLRSVAKLRQGLGLYRAALDADWLSEHDPLAALCTRVLVAQFEGRVAR